MEFKLYEKVKLTDEEELTKYIKFLGHVFESKIDEWVFNDGEDDIIFKGDGVYINRCWIQLNDCKKPNSIINFMCVLEHLRDYGRVTIDTLDVNMDSFFY